MHSCYFVLIPKNEAKNEEKARTQAMTILENEQFFYGEGGYFSSGKGDWGVVGGRWTGLLTGKEYEINDKKTKNYRSTYITGGYKNDAMILSQKILDILAKNRPNTDFDGKKLKGTWNYLDTEVFDVDIPEEFTVKDLIKNKKDYLGKYWIVVIDYHS